MNILASRFTETRGEAFKEFSATFTSLKQEAPKPTLIESATLINFCSVDIKKTFHAINNQRCRFFLSPDPSRIKKLWYCKRDERQRNALFP